MPVSAADNSMGGTHTTKGSDALLMSLLVALLVGGPIAIVLFDNPPWRAEELAREREKHAEDAERERKAREAALCNNSKTKAFEIAQRFITRGLKVPWTAEFPSTPDDSLIESIGNCTYRINSYVDAENILGIKVRSRYTVLVQYAGNDQWYTLQESEDDELLGLTKYSSWKLSTNSN